MPYFQALQEKPIVNANREPRYIISYIQFLVSQENICNVQDQFSTIKIQDNSGWFMDLTLHLQYSAVYFMSEAHIF